MNASAQGLPTRRRPAAGSAIRLRPPLAADEGEFLGLAHASRALHGRWVRAPRTPAEYATWLARVGQPGHHALLVCRAADGRIAGMIHISNIVLGAFRSGCLGYYAFAGHQRQGVMRAGLQAAVRMAFTTLGLHRLEANIQPANSASIGLVRACGFQCEGFSPRYLKIAGRWCDHERWAIVAR